jgi:hypothetical protein
MEAYLMNRYDLDEIAADSSVADVTRVEYTPQELAKGLGIVGVKDNSLLDVAKQIVGLDDIEVIEDSSLRDLGELQKIADRSYMQAKHHNDPELAKYKAIRNLIKSADVIDYKGFKC